MNNTTRVPQARAVAAAPALNLTDDLSLSQLGQVFTRSGFFSGIKDEAQAIVKILYGRELGISPVTAMMGIHIINGKPAPSADLMAVLIKRSGRYTYKIDKLDNEGCTISFYEHGEKMGESTFTRQDAQAAQLLGSDTWKKYFRNMAFARALSNGARWYTPDVFGLAVYVPEELGASVDGDGNVIDVAAQPAPRSTVEASFRDRLEKPVPIRPVVEVAAGEPFTEGTELFIRPHDDLAEPDESADDDLPAPPRADAIYYDRDGDLALWLVGPLVCYVRAVNGKAVLASVRHCPEHGVPFQLRVESSNPKGWAHKTAQGPLCQQFPVDTICSPRTGEILYDAGDTFPLDGQ